MANGLDAAIREFAFNLPDSPTGKWCVVVGAAASGKTQVAVRSAKGLGSELIRRQYDAYRGQGLSMLAYYLTLHDLLKVDPAWFIWDESDTLRIGDSVYQIKRRDRSRNTFDDLVRTAQNDEWPCYRPRSRAERLFGLGQGSASADLSSHPGRDALLWIGHSLAGVARRTVRRIQGRLQRPRSHLTLKQFIRDIRRQAQIVVRRLLGIQGHRHTEVFEAVTHSHTVDQDLIRGPTIIPETFINLVFRELVAT